MPKYVDIFVGPADEKGEVPLVYVHSDAVNMAAFGTREAPKVSHIHFDPVSQDWYATLLDGKEIARNASRAVVVEEEKHVIDDMFARGDFIPGGYQRWEFDRPQFQHDCSKCKFLGHWEGIDPNYATPRTVRLDLYYCAQSSCNSPTVIARYGNDGPDYTSGIPCKIEPLQVAQARAIYKGYLSLEKSNIARPAMGGLIDGHPSHEHLS